MYSASFYGCLGVAVIGVICFGVSITLAFVGPSLSVFEPEGELCKRYVSLSSYDDLVCENIKQNHHWWSSSSDDSSKANIDVIAEGNNAVHSYVYNSVEDGPEKKTLTQNDQWSGTLQPDTYEMFEIHFPDSATSFVIEVDYDGRGDFYVLRPGDVEEFNKSHTVPDWDVVGKNANSARLSSPVLYQNIFPVASNLGRDENKAYNLTLSYNFKKYDVEQSKTGPCEGDCKFKNVPHGGFVVVVYTGNDIHGPNVTTVIHRGVPTSGATACKALGIVFAVISALIVTVASVFIYKKFKENNGSQPSEVAPLRRNISSMPPSFNGSMPPSFSGSTPSAPSFNGSTPSGQLPSAPSINDAFSTQTPGDVIYGISF